MRWDHYVPKWVLRSFRDPDGNYYHLTRGDGKPGSTSLQKTGSGVNWNRTIRPDGQAYDSEPFWTSWDTPAGATAAAVANGRANPSDLATIVIWACSLPLRSPMWRGAAERETDAHHSNAGSVYLAQCVVGPQVREAFERDVVSCEILVAGEGAQFISGDCGCVYVDTATGVESPTFVLPWDVSSFEPDEPDPSWNATPPKPLSVYASITPSVAVHFSFGQGGGDLGQRTLSPAEVENLNLRYVRVAHRSIYGTRETLTRYPSVFSSR